MCPDGLGEESIDLRKLSPGKSPSHEPQWNFFFFQKECRMLQADARPSRTGEGNHGVSAVKSPLMEARRSRYI